MVKTNGRIIIFYRGGEMTSIIFKARDGRVGVKTVYCSTKDFLKSEMKNSDDVTEWMCWDRGERKYISGKGYIYKKRYYLSKDIVGVYYFSKLHCTDYLKAMKVMYQEVKKDSDGKKKDSRNLLKDKERESKERRKELMLELKNKREEIRTLENEYNTIKKR
jgi:hypothetical protein